MVKWMERRNTSLSFVLSGIFDMSAISLWYDIMTSSKSYWGWDHLAPPLCTPVKYSQSVSQVRQCKGRGITQRRWKSYLLNVKNFWLVLRSGGIKNCTLKIFHLVSLWQNAFQVCFCNLELTFCSLILTKRSSPTQSDIPKNNPGL